MLHGLTEKKPQDLVVLAKSWLHAPEMKILDGDYESFGYDQTERAYVVQANKRERPLPWQFELLAEEESPLINPALIVKGWGEITPEVYLDNRLVPIGELCRVGHVSTLEGVNLVVWLKLESTRPVRLSLRPGSPNRPPWE
jgi:hypothetical protein